MRLVTWNCRLDIDGKRHALGGLAPDVAVVPESAASPDLASDLRVTHVWTGQATKKGLGVFGFAPWSVHPVEESDPLPWCLPVEARNPAGARVLVLAVWTVKRPKDGRPSYSGQLTEVIERWADVVAAERVIIAGDFNASLQGPSVKPHRRNLERLASLGAHSAFQLRHGPVPPELEPATLRWVGPGLKPYHFHCDFGFVSKALSAGLREVEVGSLDEWVHSGLSDHCPVSVELGVD